MAVVGGPAPGPPVFAILAGGPLEAPREALGPWAVLPGPAPRAVAFGPAGMGAGVPVAPIWQVNLPPAPAVAAARLADGEDRLAGEERGLAAAATRLDAFVRTGSVVSFTTPRGLDPAEATLRATIAELRGEAPRSLPFGLGETLAGAWDEAVDRFRAGADWLRRLALGEAWVETRLGERWLGRSAVGWGGDAETVWAAGLDPATAALHGRAVALALASRVTTLRRVALAARGAVTLSALLAPGGVLLALPAAWRFIADVIDEVEAARARDPAATGTEEARGGE